jgi:phenylacetate-CoA ligase
LDFREITEWPAFLSRPMSQVQDVRRGQDRRLRKMVQHAATRVPYYRELFRKLHLDPRDIRTASDLQHVPVTGKTELQARPIADFLAEGSIPYG